MRTSGDEAGPGTLSHEAVLYREPEEMERRVRAFLQDGLAANEPSLVLVPAERIPPLRRGLGEAAAGVRFEDMTELGLNPARVIPALVEWVRRSARPVRIVSEPLWRGRSEAELIEVLRHEALVETALGGARARLLCLFDERAIPACARSSLERSHHRIGESGGAVREGTREPHRAAELLDGGRPLEPLGEPVERLPVTRNLQRMRRQIEASRALSGLPRARRSDFVLAVNEVATNALRYDEPPRALRLWRRRGAVVCEVVGRGRIDDPMVGRRRPDPAAVRGRGLWMVNQLCDLVELRSSASRTTLRIHMRCRRPFAEGPGGEDGR